MNKQTAWPINIKWMIRKHTANYLSHKVYSLKETSKYSSDSGPDHKLSAIKGFYDRCLFKLLVFVVKEKKELTAHKGTKKNKKARGGEQVDSNGEKEGDQIS